MPAHHPRGVEVRFFETPEQWRAWLEANHATATEDWPVLTRETMSFGLKPVNFFDRNPALDLRRAPFEAP